ncbi:39S ribosomal protein L14, mitochondrial-like [Lytechinus variegatus]|uniref:39S ribosomal protein L14, mitochondrial-like n=1 Tax=Lytechinus variegatus TaxID=7654 RepID=UPI001BB19FD1|nr:39S ribosomal protein L14, mitochondrial-like [Lytechinus variegatus]
MAGLGHILLKNSNLIGQHLSDVSCRAISASSPCNAIILLTRLRCVDNSSLGAESIRHKPPRCIHVYNKQRIGNVGDKILVAIKGQKKKALVVGVRRPGASMLPRFDTNNLILLEENGNPTGTRIKVPIPSHLRSRPEFSKVFAIASKFV